MDIHNFLLFAFASLMLNITPGNDMMYVASRSTGQGTRAGIISALGIMAGCLVHITAAVAGLSAVLVRSATAFDVIKYIGAAYLIYLGVKSLLKKATPLKLQDKMEPVSYGKIFWQGVITNVLNPKVALFFLAFLPPFINIKAAHPQWQILFLGVWFDCSGTVVNILVAILFGRMGDWLVRSQRFARIQEKITGIILIGLGIKVAFTSKK
ncbi:MAG TPA: LysE family translocator [Puia sp.]|nr:LysE family translocator [Puia sp.]